MKNLKQVVMVALMCLSQATLAMEQEDDLQKTLRLSPEGAESVIPAAGPVSTQQEAVSAQAPIQNEPTRQTKIKFSEEAPEVREIPAEGRSGKTKELNKAGAQALKQRGLGERSRVLINNPSQRQKQAIIDQANALHNAQIIEQELEEERLEQDIIDELERLMAKHLFKENKEEPL